MTDVPLDQTVSGFDCSEFQGQIDWNQAKEGGIKFAIIRAAYSDSHTDTRFAENMTASRSVGIRRSAYHYVMLGRASAQAQADYFAKVVEPYMPLDFAPFVDLEQDPYKNGNGLLEAFQMYSYRLNQVLGVKPGIYTNPGFAARVNLTGIDPKTPLWVADWNMGSTTPPDFWGFTSWDVWQIGLTPPGKIPGIATQGLEDRMKLGFFNADIPTYFDLVHHPVGFYGPSWEDSQRAATALWERGVR